MSTSFEQPGFDAVIIHPVDQVATALRPLSAGERVRLGGPGSPTTIVAVETIPLCHKIAIKSVNLDEPVYKYGEFIGKATRVIKPGEHVHIHNIESLAAKFEE